MTIERCTVDNRVFLLGLDELYREAMKTHEREELLASARRVATVLSVQPADVPVEGYYTEDEQLTEYFLLMRALQEVSKSRKAEVQGLPEFARLQRVTASGLFGHVSEESSLLPGGIDPLSTALKASFPEWSIRRLTAAAYRAALESDDFSLVGLAALARDSVLIAAARESVVLYVEGLITTGPPQELRFLWDVAPRLAERAQRFIATFNELFDESLPDAVSGSAEAYWCAAGNAAILGRCVCLGLDDRPQPAKFYHWAVDMNRDGDWIVRDFWDTELWTTERYRRQSGLD